MRKMQYKSPKEERKGENNDSWVIVFDEI